MNSENILQIEYDEKKYFNEIEQIDFSDNNCYEILKIDYEKNYCDEKYVEKLVDYNSENSSSDDKDVQNEKIEYQNEIIDYENFDFITLFNTYKYLWKNDKYILWALCYTTRDHIGYNFRQVLIKDIRKKNKNLFILNILDKHEEWYKKKNPKYMYINYDTIGLDNEDPIKMLAKNLNIEKIETDKNKKILCQFFKGKGCNKGATCTYSHHPSMVWNEMIENITPWIYCDVPKNKFSLIFSLSNKLMMEFNVVIKVPYKISLNENSLIKLKGDMNEINKCLKKISDIIKTKVSIVKEHTELVIDLKDKHNKIEDNSLLYEKINEEFTYSVMGKEQDDPIRILCDKLEITEHEIDNNGKKYKSQLCCFFRRYICINGTECTYSHHPSMLWDYAPGEWSLAWTRDECVLWALCYAPRNNIGNSFRRKIIEKVKLQDTDYYYSDMIINVFLKHYNWIYKKSQKIN